MRKIALPVVICIALLAGRAGYLFAASGDSTVMLQGFHWTSWQTSPWWNEVGSRAGDISGAGIDLVWLPPPSDSLSSEGYMPRRLDMLDSGYGSEAQLYSLLQTLHAAGIRAIADVVMNHRVGVKDWADFQEPAWDADSVCSDDEWGKGEGAPDTGKGFHAARDIDHTKTYVRDSLRRWLGTLRGIGFDGWRYDYARGFAPQYILGYNRASGSGFSVAEIWDDFNPYDPDSHRQALCDWMDSVGGEVKTFDFTTKGLLQQAMLSGDFRQLSDTYGRPGGLIGWWPNNAVTFIDNHDTGPSPGGKLKDKAWPFPSSKVAAGYAYILTHPGIPCVYWPHFFDWGMKDEISALIRIRRDAGIDSSSRVKILRAEYGLYAAIVDGKVALKLGDRPWDPGSGWSQAARGTSYSVWVR